MSEKTMTNTTLESHGSRITEDEHPFCMDIFCGMGGWSIGFYREGFNCRGVDVVDVGYPYELTLSDVRDFHPRPGCDVDVMVMSPPCTEFSVLTTLSYKKGQRGPPEPEKGIELVREAMRIKDEGSPRYWVLENVVGSIPHLRPILGEPRLVAKPWVLWGNFPMPQLPEFPRGDHKTSHSFERHNKGGNRIGLPEDFPFDPLRSWRRARIPTFLAQAMARACKE